jgi:hypothetical protein
MAVQYCMWYRILLVGGGTVKSIESFTINLRVTICVRFYYFEVSWYVLCPVYYAFYQEILRFQRIFVHHIVDVGGKQWQPTPKNLPRMQCARAISVT